MPFYYDGELVVGPQGPAGPDGNPIGTVISFLGLTAPEGYLACDGTEHRTAEYPALAAFFREQFGASSHFGGDGETTFAVPDMRNLFLRGYHGEAEEQFSGEVGAKQEGTFAPAVTASEDGRIIIPVPGPNTANLPLNVDVMRDYTHRIQVSSSVVSSGALRGTYMGRPVNMAVLYCIKAVESTPGGMEEYDTGDGWHVRKWSGGYCELIYQWENEFVSSADSLGGYYWSIVLKNAPFPLQLVEKYREIMSILDDGGDDFIKIPAISAVKKDDCGKTGIYCMLINHVTQATFTYSLKVEGRWK